MYFNHSTEVQEMQVGGSVVSTEVVDFLTGEIHDNPCKVNENTCDINAYDVKHLPPLSSDERKQLEISKQLKILRFALQNQSVDILSHCNVGKLYNDKNKEFSPRLFNCLRKPIPQSSTTLSTSPANLRNLFYTGLQVCGSVWICPVCMSKITERRRRQLSHLVNVAKEQGYSPMLLTLTFRHNKGQSLSFLWNKLTGEKSMYSAFSREFTVKRLFKEHGIIKPKVRTTEVLYNDVSGWHIHLHIMLMTNKQGLSKIRSLEYALRQKWCAVLSRYGLSGIPKYALNLKVGNELISNYIAKYGTREHLKQIVEDNPKWTIAHEVMKATSKYKRGIVGKDGKVHKTGLPILNLLDLASTNEEYKRAYIEYAQASYGRRSVAGLPALARFLDVPKEDYEKKDETIAKEFKQDKIVMALLTGNDLRRLVKLGKRGHVLAVYASGGVMSLKLFLDSLGCDDVTYPVLMNIEED